MSFRNDIYQHREENNNGQKYSGKQPQTKSPNKSRSSNSEDDSHLRKNIQRSTYLQDEDLQQKDKGPQLQQKLKDQLFTSQYGTSQRKLNNEEKLSQKIITSQQNVQKPTAVESEHEQYESISSENSQKEKQDRNVELIKQTQYKNILQTPLANKSSSYMKQRQLGFQDDEQIPPLKTHQSKKSPIIKSNDQFINSSGKISQPEQHHATFNLFAYDKKQTLNSTSILPIRQKSSHETSNQPKSFNSSSNSQSNKNVNKSNEYNIIQKNKSEQIKYPSVILSNNQKKSSNKESSKQMDFQESLNYLKSPKNYALPMKKMTSDESAKRTESTDKVHIIEDTNQKFKQFHENKSQSLQKSKHIEQKEFNKIQQANLFYVSVSNQQMYPSLDLKQGMGQVISLKETGRSLVKQIKKTELKKQDSSKKQAPKIKHEPDLPCRIKISQYHSQYFLKIQTQIFSIQIQYPPHQKEIEIKSDKNESKQLNINKQSEQQHRIQRRFSDFVFLYEGIMTNHLGYIIYPFPQKSLQSFFKIKLHSLIGSTVSDGSTNHEAEKMQLIQRRIEELQKFVNYLLCHEELRYSQQLAIFLCKDPELYQRSRERIQKYIEQYKQLQSSNNLIEQGKKNIKKAIQTGVGMVMKWWGSSLAEKQDLSKRIQKSRQSRQVNVVSSVSQSNIQFSQYQQTLDICFAKFDLLQKSILKLLQTHQNLVSFRDIDTEFDYLIKLSAKISSGKEYSRKLILTIDNELIREVQQGRRWLEQTKLQLQKRQNLKQLIESLKQSLSYTSDGSSKISKLERRLERFQKNFQFGFAQLISECQKMFEESKQKFMEEWHNHSTNMKKIWK